MPTKQPTARTAHVKTEDAPLPLTENLIADFVRQTGFPIDCSRATAAPLSALRAYVASQCGKASAGLALNQLIKRMVGAKRLALHPIQRPAFYTAEALAQAIRHNNRAHGTVSVRHFDS